MTLNKRKFIEAKASGKNNTQAALAAGATKVSARNAGYKLSKQSDVQKAFKKALDRSNVKLDDIINVYVRALKATKTDKLTGEIEEDYQTQLKAADKFLDLLNLKPKKQQDPVVIQNTMTLAMKKAIQSNDDIALLALMQGSKENNQ